ncbi:TaqI-like C-terminal specificity domain-containing protein [Candidatus Albibeggiatoa sp. nov. BB20]|uniref:Eco57I restriction-modification methylase domain-containing protein n=1 Tax=Candidatus Albibeggiatoa sp. nov. BB20 TaxID=3162723 RepID=UPI0033655D0C
MSIFQKSVLQNHLNQLDEEQLDIAFSHFKQLYSPERIENIKTSKEEEYQAGFMRDIFVDIFGYILKPDVDFNLQLEFKNQTVKKKDNRKTDSAIIRNGTAIAVIELKSTNTKDLDTVTKQAFSYKNHQANCLYVITSNFQKLRFYIEHANEYEEFDLFTLNKADFAVLYLILHSQYLLQDIPLSLKQETKHHEEQISKQFYQDYSKLKQQIFSQFCKHNSQFETLVLFQKSQKFLDRLLFVLFAEDIGLIAPNSAENEIVYWQQIIDLGVSDSLYNRLNNFFAYLNSGFKSNVYDVPQYNGGLFSPDVILNQLVIDDTVLQKGILQLAKYDFSSELDVNILGRIFEHSLNELEEVKAHIAGVKVDKKATKRKKDGIFYTPQYITEYMIEQALGTLCNEKRIELSLLNIEFDRSYRTKTGKLSKKGEKLFTNLQTYKAWLLELKVLDPACGSGAFLNQALNFLIAEHQKIDKIIEDLTHSLPKLFDTDKIILENNIYGVDINEESVEIAKLSLWLRTAKKGRKLSNLNNNIKCGHSLIDDKDVAAHKAFNWSEEFPDIMQKGGFDVIIGNPPYGVNFNQLEKAYLKQFDKLVPDYEIYIYFISLAIQKLLKPTGYLFYIIPNTFLSILYGQKYRQMLSEHYNIPHIVDLSKDDVFIEAQVRTCLFALRHQTMKQSYTQFTQVDPQHKTFATETISLKQSVLSDNTENWLSLPFSIHKQKLIQKLNKHSKLTQLFQVSQGLIPYDKYRGHSEEMIKNRTFHAKYQKDQTYRKELKGSDITRYQLEWNGELWISYGSWLAAPREPKFFTQERVLIREITSNYLFCTYSLEEYYNSPSIINIVQDKNSLNLKYLLTILNSKLIGWYHNAVSPKARKGLFPKILVNDVRNLPIRTISNTQQYAFIEKAEYMLLLHQTLQNKKNKFINRLNSNFELKKMTKKLSRFYDFDFKMLLDELKKQKIKLTLVQQDEWEDYFTDYKIAISQVQIQIHAADQQIDQMIYQLYGLTQDEIELVEQQPC